MIQELIPIFPEMIMLLILIVSIFLLCSNIDIEIDENSLIRDKLYYVKYISPIVAAIFLPNLLFSLQQIFCISIDLILDSWIETEMLLNGGIRKYFNLFHYTLHGQSLSEANKKFFVIIHDKSSSNIIDKISVDFSVDHPKTYHIIAGKYSHIVFMIERIKNRYGCKK